MECCLELLDRGTLASLQDLGAAGLSSSLVGDGLEGRGRARHRRVEGAAARGRHGAVRDHDLRVPGADAVRGRAASKLAELRRSASAGRCARRSIGEVTDSRRLRVLDGDEVVGDMPVEALVDDCPLYDLEPAAPDEPDLPGARRARSTPTTRGGAARAAGLVQPRPRAGRCSSSTTRSCSRARCAGPRRPTPRCCSSPDDGWQQRASPSRSTATAAAWPATPTPARSRRCSSARPTSPAWAPSRWPDQLPQLRQPREAARGLAARALGARAWPTRCTALGVPVVGGNVSLYNESGDGPIYPTPVVGMVGTLPDAGAPRRARLRARGRHDRASAASSRRALPGSELAKLRGEELPTELPERRPGEGRAAAQEAVRDAVRAGELVQRPRRGRGRLPWRSPSAASPAGSARRSALPDEDRRDLFGEGVGRASSSPARAPRSRAWTPTTSSSARSAATRCGSGTSLGPERTDGRQGDPGAAPLRDALRRGVRTSRVEPASLRPGRSRGCQYVARWAADWCAGRWRRWSRSGQSSPP